MAERGVQIAKKMLTKCHEDKTDVRLALLQYRASPVLGTNFSPSELLMNRNLRTKLLSSSNYLKPKLNKNVMEQFNNVKNRNIRNYNRTCRSKNKFIVGQKIWFKKNPSKNVWSEGEIFKINGFRSYVVLDKDNVQYHRTSFHVRPA